MIVRFAAACATLARDMEREGQDISGHGALAEQAGPVRRWLRTYFRRRVRGDHEVDDLVQEVFVRIVGRDARTPVDHLGRYVARTAASVLADRGRRGAARHADRHVAFDADQHGGEAIDPERILSGRERLHVATAVLLGLPERTRSVFLLRRLEGCRHAEIAQRLGISVSAVEKHMVRALRDLMTAMEDHDAA